MTIAGLDHFFGHPVMIHLFQVGAGHAREKRVAGMVDFAGMARSYLCNLDNQKC